MKVGIMKVRIQCPHCNTILTIPTTLAGKKGKCPGCGQIIQIPTSLIPPGSPPSSESSPANKVYDAEDASTESLSMPEPAGVSTPSPFGDANVGGGTDDDLGYGLSGDLLSELDRQPAIPSPYSNGPERVPCPVCKELIVRGAAKCHHCGEIFDLVLKEHERHKQLKKQKGGDDDDLTGLEIAVGLICGGVSCIISIIWMIQGKKKGIKMFGLALLSLFILRILGLIVHVASHPLVP